MSELKIGQKLWFVPSFKRGHPYEVTVTKIGKLYAYLDDRDRRIHKGSLQVDGRGYNSPGQCYLSKAAYEEEAALDAAWVYFRNFIRDRYTRPTNVSVEDIHAAMKALHMVELPDVSAS